MKGKRTEIDFEEHQLFVTERDGLLVHYLKKPDTIFDNIKFINTNGILAVTGDYSNWMFCREFHPTADGHVSDYYWIEKLRIASCQEPEEFDSEETEAQIKKLLAEEEDLDEEEKEYLEGCLSRVDDKFDYEHYAHTENCGRFQDHENVPDCKKIKRQLLVVFDGFDEICRRMKEEPEKIIHKESDIEKAKSYLNDHCVDPDGTGIMHGERMKEVMKIMGVEFTGTENGWQLINKQ